METNYSPLPPPPPSYPPLSTTPVYQNAPILPEPVAQPLPVQQTPPVNNNKSSIFQFFLRTLFLLFIVVAVATFFYYLGVQNGKKMTKSPNNNTLADNPTDSLPTPDLSSMTPKDSPLPTSSESTQSAEVQTINAEAPSEWVRYSAHDPEFGIKTLLALPPGFSFKFTGSESTIQNTANSQEIWDYQSSVFNGKSGIKNYYTTSLSVTNWYTNYLKGDYLLEIPATYEPGKIEEVKEFNLNDKNTFYQLKITGKPPVNLVTESDTHFLFLQNGVIHILRPSSAQAISQTAAIPNNIAAIFSSLDTTLTK